MPGFDGTGPRGEGPITGGGRGFCFYGVGRGGMPWGGGRGRAWGGGRGRGRRFGFANPFVAEPNESDERRYLADQMSILEEEIRAIKERLAELDKKK